MQPLGYLYKHVASRPEWLKAEGVEDVYSLSGCISSPFADYMNFWQHNGFWLFNSPAMMKALAAEHSLSLEGTQLFYYEGYELEFDDAIDTWVEYQAEASFETRIEAPVDSKLEGFDVTCFSVHTTPECSPLSCNSLASSLATNRHCLFKTFDEAKSAIEAGKFEASEPGPYRIVAVYSVGDETLAARPTPPARSTSA
jgi:hypothetical protein